MGQRHSSSYHEALLLKETLLAFGSLFSIVDPFSAVPAFLALAGHKCSIALRAALTCFAVLSIFGVAGTFIFNFFGITIPAFKVAGGILLFGVALEMMRAKHSGTRSTPEEESEVRDDVALIPLGLPLLSGPGAIAAVMVLSGKAANVEARVAVHLAILGIGVASFVVLASAAFMSRALGRTGINIIGRLMGLILAALAIQFVIDGAREAFPRMFG
jgi:multiple antibiotic resistance protein